jgi:hypothetical protein
MDLATVARDRVTVWITRLRRCNIRPFFGLTALLAVIYAPVVTYTLWLHFKNYGGPMWVLAFPVLAATLSGYADHKLSAFRGAVLLTSTAYFIAVGVSVVEFIAGTSPWYEVPMTVLFAALWFSTAIFVLTLVLVMFGRALWLLLNKGQ